MSPPIAGSSHATSSGNLAMQSGMSSENPQENEVSYKAPDDETGGATRFSLPFLC